MLSVNIKEATKTAHLQLEKVVVQRLKAIHSDAGYADLLKHFYSYFSTVEKAIAPYITLAVLPDYKQRRNSAYLKNDIEELGSHTQELPPATAPLISNTAEALGALYVMEGSIMGGRIIVQMLQKSGITKGLSFFSGYGEATGNRWATFTAVLNREGAAEEAAQAAIKTANDTFSQFEKVFEKAPAR